MTKAKTLDRIELTRRKIAAHEAQKHGHGIMAEVQEYFADTPAYPRVEEHQEQRLHGDICPFCGRNTLIHESGCVKCIACNWSKCG